MAARMTEDFENFEDLEYVENVPQELICSICFRVLCEPHLVNCCEQQFCKDCLETWLEDNTSCPHCRSSGFSYMLMKQSNRKVGELKVYCLNKHHGCKAELKISEYHNHLSTANHKGCAYVQLDCPNNCSAKVFRGKMLEHQQKLCPKRIVSCEHCKLKGEYLPMVKDHLNKCLLKPVGCPLACGVSVLRKDLQTHRNECPLELVPCSFSGLGCKTKVCRKDLKEHINSGGLSHHMDLLAMSHMTMQAKHAALQIEHTTLNRVCTSLQKEYITLQMKHQELLKEHTTLNDACTSLQEEYITLQVEQQELLKEHTTLKDTYNSLKKDQVTLQTAHTSLQKNCAFLDREQLALIAEHDTLEGTCKSLQIELATLQRSQGQLQKEHSALIAALEEESVHPLQPTIASVLARAKLPDKKNIKSSVTEPPRQTRGDTSKQTLQSTSTPTLGKTSKQTLGNTFYLPLEQDGIGGDHTVALNNTTLKLEWEPDDLFEQSHVKNFLFSLYLLSGISSFDVLVSSGYGDSGQLAIVCCGQPQTTLWGGMPTNPSNPSKKLVGSLFLQCNNYDKLKVSLSHHTCKCSCHVIKH